MQIKNGYSIKIADFSHIPLLASIEIAAASIFPPGSIPEHIRSDCLPQSVLFEATQKGLLWVALAREGKPVGYALVQFFDDAALLAQIDVHPEHMRNGIGSALVKYIVGYLKSHGISFLYLTTFRHIPWNAPFYKKLGFKELNRKEIPLFIKSILNNEKHYGLKNRIAMQLELPY